MASRSRKRSSAAQESGGAKVPALDFRAIVDSAPDVIYVLDLEGRFAYLNARAYEVFGYDRDEGEQLLGREPLETVLAPSASADAVGAIQHRVEFPRDRQIFRIEARRKDGSPIALEVHGSPLWSGGRIAGRIGICRVLDATDRADEPAARSSGAHGLQEERMRIARGMRDAITQIVFGVTADLDASESFLVDVKRATLADLARRLRLDETDLAILRRIAAGASNREIGPEVHLSAAAVKDRIRRLMNRLGTRRRAELAAHALRLGLA